MHPKPPGDSLVAAWTDAASIRKLMRGEVTYAGMWFDDPECVRQFPAAAKIEGARLDAFASCLAGLHLQASKRHDYFVDVAVLSYAPGIEIEALVENDADGPRLGWIGYSGRHDLGDALPTITGEALEALRVAGDRNGPVDPAAMSELYELQGERKSYAQAWLKVCIDAEGTVTSVHAREATSLGASHAFTAAARTWHFRPFVVGNHGLPVCSLARLTYPPDQAASIETLPVPSTSADELVVVPPQAMEAHRIFGEKLIKPDEDVAKAIQQHGVAQLVGVFKLCIDETGHVTDVTMLRSTRARAYDAKIMRTMKTWVYSPFLNEGRAAPVCTAVTFIYTQR